MTRINTDEALLVAGDLTERVIGVFFNVYNELGWGFLESVYENAMTIALRTAGLRVSPQAHMPVTFRGQVIGEFKADLLVEERLVVELKAVAQLAPVHEVQLVNYLKASGIEVGLLINFGPRPQIKRRIFGSAVDPRSSALIRVENPRV